MPRWLNALPLAALLVYAVLPTKNYYWDGVDFALNIEQAGGFHSLAFWPSLIRPNHLIYNLLGYLVWSAVQGVGLHLRALYVLQAISMVAAVACLWLMQPILFKQTASAYIAATLTGICACSAIFWKYSTDADAYIPSVLFLIAAFYALTASPRPRPIAVGLLHCGAMLIHQLAAFFFPAAALAIFLQGGWKSLSRYCLMAVGITLPAYYAGFRLQRREAQQSFINWLTSHSPDSSFTFNLPRDLAITISSYARLFFGGTAHLLQFFGPFMLITLVLLAIVLARLIVLIVRYRSDFRLFTSGAPKDRQLFRIALVWFASYFVFLLFWLPQNTFYKLFCLPAILVIAAHYSSQYSGPRRHRLVLLVAAMALANLALYIYPYSRPDYNQSLRFAMRMGPLWSDRTVVYYRINTVDNWFIRYFNPETSWKALDPAENASAFVDSAQRDTASGRDVWVDITAGEFLAGNGIAVTDFRDAQEDNFQKHPIRFMRWAPH